jgi:hypothetical protein
MWGNSLLSQDGSVMSLITGANNTNSLTIKNTYDATGTGPGITFYGAGYGSTYNTGKIFSGWDTHDFLYWRNAFIKFILPAEAGGALSENILELRNNYAAVSTPLMVGTTSLTDPLAGNDKFKVVDGTMTLGFRDNSTGQGYLCVSSSTNGIGGFLGHTNTVDGYVMGSYTNHAFSMRTNNINRFVITNAGLIGFNAYGTGRPLLTAGAMSLAPLTAAEMAAIFTTPTTNYLQKYNGSGLTNSLTIDDGTYQSTNAFVRFGAGTWPSSAFSQLAGRVGLIQDNTDPALIIVRTTSTPHADCGGIIYLGSRATTGVENTSYGRIVGAKTNSTSGNFLSYLSFTTLNAAGAEIEGMRINSTGVGVGTTAPGSILDISDAAPEVHEHGYGSVPYYGFYRHNGTEVSPTAVVATNRLGVLFGAGQYDATVGHAGIGGSVEFWADSDFSFDHGYATSIRFYTCEYGSSSRTERARITSDGKIGIGTAAPINGLLDVNGTGGGAAGIHLNSASPAVATAVLYNNGGNLYWNGNLLSLGTGGTLMGSGAENNLAKWTDTDTIGNSIITDDGTNVGINGLLFNVNIGTGFKQITPVTDGDTIAIANYANSQRVIVADAGVTVTADLLTTPSIYDNGHLTVVGGSIALGNLSISAVSGSDIFIGALPTGHSIFMQSGSDRFNIGNIDNLDSKTTITGKLTVTGDVVTAIGNYASTSTITGFSSYSLKNIYYRKVGKQVTIFWDLNGDGTGTETSFTVPYTAAHTSWGGNFIHACLGQNNGTTASAFAILNENTSTVICYPNGSLGNWTNLTTRETAGQLTYFTD